MQTDKERPCIMAVDDDEQILRFLSILLGRYAIAYRTVADGASAVDLFRKHREDIVLILLDVQMPVLDGPAVLSRLRAIDPDVKCWFMSGDTGAYSEEDLLALGASGLLSKPIELSSFAALLISVGVAAPSEAEADRT